MAYYFVLMVGLFAAVVACRLGRSKQNCAALTNRVGIPTLLFFNALDFADTMQATPSISDKRQQRVGLRDVMDLPTREAERQRIAQGVNDHMDFRREPAARAADGLVETPFLRAPAEC
jgi:hypothetical protein